MCPARDFNFTKQQQVALKLQRLDGQSEGQYAWWTIVSLVLQADSSAAGAWRLNPLMNSWVAEKVAWLTDKGMLQGLPHPCQQASCFSSRRAWHRSALPTAAARRALKP